MTPLKQYETNLLWVNDVCYNPVERKGRRMFANLQMEEIEYPFHLPRLDYVENVKVIIFSVEPPIWSENDDLFVCENTKSASSVYRSIVKKRDTKVSK